MPVRVIAHIHPGIRGAWPRGRASDPLGIGICPGKAERRAAPFKSKSATKGEKLLLTRTLFALYTLEPLGAVQGSLVMLLLQATDPTTLGSSHLRGH